MASAVIGAAVIRVLPETTGFAGKVRREMQSAAAGASRPFRDLGFNIKRQLTSAFSAGLASINNLKVGAQSLSRFFARNFTIPIGIALGAITKLTTEFQSGMLRVEALTTNVGDSVQVVNTRMEQLTQTALDLGRTTEFTSNQASEAMQSFALAGFDANEILDATESTLSLASAGQVDLAKAADTTATAIRSFNLEASDSARVADVFTQTFTNSNTTLDQLAQGFKFVGPVASAAGLTFEETTAALGILSNAGLKASIAGTSLRGIITKLINPSEKAKGIIEQLGIAVFDASGNMRPLVDIVRDFEGSMREFGIEVRDGNGGVRDLNDILGEVAGTGGNVAGVFETITGLDSAQFLEENAAAFKEIGVDVFDTNGTLKSFSQVIGDSRVNAVTASQAMAIFAQRAGPGMLALVSQGADALENLTTANLNSAGRAAEIQAKQMEGLRGSFLLVKSAAEGLAISIGLTFAGSLSNTARGLADFINRITDWVEENKELTAGIVKIASALAALGPGFFLVAKGIGLILAVLEVSPLQLFLVALAGVALLFKRMLDLSPELRDSLDELFHLLGVVAGPILKAIGAGFGFLADGADSLAQTLGGQLADKIGEVNAKIEEWVESGGLTKLVEKIWEISTAIKDFASEVVGPLLGQAGDVALQVFNAIVAVIETLTPLIEGLIPVVADLAATIGGVFLTAIEQVAKAIEFLADLLRPFTELIGGNMTPVLLAAGAAFLAFKTRAAAAALAAGTLSTSATRMMTPLRSMGGGLSNLGDKAGGVANKLQGAANKMTVLGGPTQKLGQGFLNVGARLDGAGNKLRGFSDKLKAAGVTGQTAVVGLVSAFAGFQIGRQIAQAEEFGDKLSGLASAAGNIAIAFAIGGPIAGALAATATAIGLFVEKVLLAEEAVYALGDAAQSLDSAFSDSNFTASEAQKSWSSYLDSISKDGVSAFGKLQAQVDEFSDLDLSFDRLGEAAATSAGAYADFVDDFLGESARLRIGVIQDFSELDRAIAFERIVDPRSNLLESLDPGPRRDAAVEENLVVADRFFESYSNLLSLPDAELGIDIDFDDVDGVSEAFLKFEGRSDEAKANIDQLNSILSETGRNFDETRSALDQIDLSEFFGKDDRGKGIELALIAMADFGDEVDTARIKAQFLAPALEKAKEEQDALRTATNTLGDQYDDLSRSVSDATRELKALAGESVTGAEIAQDLAANIGDGFDRFRDEFGNLPDLGDLFVSTDPGEQGKQFNDFLTGSFDLLEEWVVQAAVGSKTAEEFAGGIDFIKEAFRTMLADAGLAPDKINEVLALFEDESFLKLEPEIIFNSQEIREAKKTALDLITKEIGVKVEAGIEIPEEERLAFQERIRQITGNADFVLDPASLDIKVNPPRPESVEAALKETRARFADIELEIKVKEQLPNFDRLVDVSFQGLAVPIKMVVPAGTDIENFARETLAEMSAFFDALVLGGEGPKAELNLLSPGVENIRSMVTKTNEDVAAQGGVKIPVNFDVSSIPGHGVLAPDKLQEEVNKATGKTTEQIEKELAATPPEVNVDINIKLSEQTATEVQAAIDSVVMKVNEALAANPILVSVKIPELGLGGETGINQQLQVFLTLLGVLGAQIPFFVLTLNALAIGFTRVGETARGMAVEVIQAVVLITSALTSLFIATTSIFGGMVSMLGSMGGIIKAISRAIAVGFAAPLAFAAGSVWPPFAALINSVAGQFGIPGVPASGPAIPTVPSFHTGGIVGKGDGPQRAIGDVRSGERMALLQDGEGVLPREAMRGLTPREFEDFRKGIFTPDPRDGIGGPFEEGQAYVKGKAEAGEFINPFDAGAVNTEIAFFGTDLINSITGVFGNLIMAQVAQAAFGELSLGIMDFIRGASDAALEVMLANIPGLPPDFDFSTLPDGFDIAGWRERMAGSKGPGSWQLITAYLAAAGVPYLVNSTFRPGDGGSYHALNRAVDLGAPGDSNYDSPGLLRIDHALAPLLGVLSELIYAGPGFIIDKAYDAATMADHHDHVHAALANGAVIRSHVLAELGEAGDEVVIPLDRPERAMALALQSGLFDTLSRATESSPRSAPVAGTPGSTVLGDFDGGPLGGGPGNTYNLVGVGLNQVKAEIAARDEATVRVRR